MNNLTAGLNEEQKQAVLTTEGPMLIIAGAGSGKTRVLTHKIAHLVGLGIRPYNILAITFTNKAAKEMKMRLNNLLGDASAQQLWVGTFHFICLQILRRNVDEIGYSSNFVIYDSGDQKTLIKQCLKSANLDDKQYTPQGMLAAISNAKNKMLTPEQFAKDTSDYYEEKVAAVYKLYQKHLKDANAVDFDDILLLAVKLLRQNSELLAYYQEKFAYVLVDEYQDTNKVQYHLVKLLAAKHKNICVVGDPDQSIYGWRGADIANILAFEEDYPHVKVIKLEQNYRSTPAILQAANQVIANNAGRKEKNLWTDKKAGEKICLCVAQDEKQEAFFVVSEIERLHKQQAIPYNKFAILYRTHALSRVMEDVLVRHGLPYEIFGGVKFYDRKEVKDIVAYLKLIMNPADIVSFRRVINLPKRGIGETTVAKIIDAAAELEISPMELLCNTDIKTLLPEKTKAKLLDFTMLIDELWEESLKGNIAHLLELILEKTGYLAELKKERNIENQTRIENLEEFVSAAAEFDQHAEEKNLEEFLGNIALVSDFDSYEEEIEKIVLMTLHTAKGLEFPVVFLIGMEEGVFPHSRALFEESEMEEERRLCYVGMTRAEERLFLTRSLQRNQFGQTRCFQASRFIKEFDKNLMAERGKNNHTDSSVRINGVANRELAADKNYGDFILGTKIIHAKWGEGVIVSTSGSGKDAVLSIAFPEQGVKSLAAEYAPIRKA